MPAALADIGTSEWPVIPGEVFLQKFIERAGEKHFGVFGGNNRDGGIEIQVVKMLADEPQAETVQGADVRRIQLGDLFQEHEIFRM